MNQSDIQKAMPAPGEISEALKKRVAAATAAAVQASSNNTNLGTNGTGQRRQLEDSDVRDVKRLKVKSC